MVVDHCAKNYKKHHKKIANIVGEKDYTFIKSFTLSFNYNLLFIVSLLIFIIIILKFISIIIYDCIILLRSSY